MLIKTMYNNVYNILDTFIVISIAGNAVQETLRDKKSFTCFGRPSKEFFGKHPPSLSLFLEVSYPGSPSKKAWGEVPKPATCAVLTIIPAYP